MTLLLRRKRQTTPLRSTRAASRLPFGGLLASLVIVATAAASDGPMPQSVLKKTTSAAHKTRLQWRPARKTTDKRTASKPKWLNSKRTKPAVKLTAGDPFNDPFGDRLAQRADDGRLLIPGNQPTPAKRSPSPGPAAPPSELPPLKDSKQPAARKSLDFSVDPPGFDPQPPASTELDLPATGGALPATGQSRLINCEDEKYKLSFINGVGFNITSIKKKHGTSGGPSIGLRTWTHRSGKYQLTAEFVKINGAKVHLKKAYGKLVKMLIEELQPADQQYIFDIWGLPQLCPLRIIAAKPRQFAPITYHWTASALCHKPLYFEQEQLERYGHSVGPFLEPAVSAAHFFLSVPIVPYKMGIHPPNECHYALGYYRPGNCAPYMIPPIPISLRGALYQAGAVTGMIYAIP